MEEKRLPTPFMGHNPSKQWPKKRSEVLKGPSVTSNKDSGDSAWRSQGWWEAPVLVAGSNADGEGQGWLERLGLPGEPVDGGSNCQLTLQGQF